MERVQLLTEPKRKRGRPENSMNRFAKDAREKAQASGMLPHEWLLAVMRGEPIYRTEHDPITGEARKVQEQYGFDDRKDAAKAAAPYYAPKISTVEVISGVSDADLDSIIASAAAQAGVSIGPGGEGKAGEDQAGEDDPQRT